MNFVILDLEWNGAYSKRLRGFMNEIIEFGAVKTDSALNTVDTFEALVRPQVGKKISGKVRTLTSITNEELTGGQQFMQVISRFRKWAGDALVLTWGTSDILALIENCRYFCGSGRVPFLKRYADLQFYCERALGSDGSKQMGLSTAAQLLGIDEDEFDHHRALGDSLLSLRCLQKLYDPALMEELAQDASTDAFYGKIEFRTIAICDLNHPLIRPSHLAFDCDLCGGRARRVGDWQLRNKSFRAEFFCRKCRRKFYGRVQFKLKYEGLTVKKTILPFVEEKTEPDSAAREVSPAGEEQ